MAWITVTTDDGSMLWTERTDPVQFESEHFKDLLLDRVQWAVEDARARKEAGSAAASRRSVREREPAARV